MTHSESPSVFIPCLCHTRGGAVRQARWVFDEKYDGDRILAYKEGDGVRLLFLGAYRENQLHYVWKVGTGFDAQMLVALYYRFQPLVRSQSALVDPPRERGVVFVAPRAGRSNLLPGVDRRWKASAADVSRPSRRQNCPGCALAGTRLHEEEQDGRVRDHAVVDTPIASRQGVLAKRRLYKVGTWPSITTRSFPSSCPT